uniref:Uncharacterized protein n=1 Tax=Rhizophora mucronata TaxID=61149 RepID=A0A2P2QFV0_RHIMU
MFKPYIFLLVLGATTSKIELISICPEGPSTIRQG